MTTDFEGETGQDIADHTGEHLHRGQLDLDVWAYLRMGSGWTVAVRQTPPQPMLEFLGTADVAPSKFTVNVANGMTTHIADRREVDDESYRIAFDECPDDVKQAVWDRASTGWVWADKTWRYDADRDNWIEAA